MKNDEVARYYTDGIDVPETADPAFDQQPWPSTRVVGSALPKVATDTR